MEKRFLAHGCFAQSDEMRFWHIHKNCGESKMYKIMGKMLIEKKGNIYILLIGV